ncbi:MAG: RluA family pseudouridine synthase [Bacilli bacterium]|nr:RluA family pseudouridine synthase [Bacilli bacterium]
MIKRYNIKLEDNQQVMIKEYLSDKLPSALLTFINKQSIRYFVNDQAVYNYYLLKNEDILEVIIPIDLENDNITPINQDFKILYEDSYLLIIDKVSNLACIPTKKHFDSSLANFVMAYYKKKGIASGIHFVNRLDYATSGIIVLSKDTYTTTLMKDARLLKKYLLIVDGIVEKDGVISSGIKKDPNSAIKRIITDDMTNSKTIYKVLKSKDFTTLIEATLVTGKTHQLRLHFSSFLYPIIGDKLYGKDTGVDLKLHSYYFEFIHPITNKKITITSYPDWYLNY